MSITLSALPNPSDLVVQQDQHAPLLNISAQHHTSVRVPFYYGMQNGGAPSSGHEKMQSEFNTLLRDYQHVMKNNVLRVLKKNKCAILSSYVGAGKTVIAIDIACKTKLRTLVVVNRILLLEQWEKSIRQFTTCETVDILTSKTTKGTGATGADFAVINGQNITKISPAVLEKYGCVILDECHTLMSSGMGIKLLQLTPKYLLGLSATPYREDGFHKILEYYFGNGIVFTKLNRKHLVYTTMTKIPFATTKGYGGTIDFNKILDSLGKNKKRNDMIIDVVSRLLERADRCCLVLVKRISHGETLANKLCEMGIDVQQMYGKTAPVKGKGGGSGGFTGRVLITTTSKAGVGFDCPRLNTLVLAAPIKNYFIQYLGRVMRSPEGVPEVYDFVDDNYILKTHYKERVKIYTEHGGVIGPGPLDGEKQVKVKY